MQLKTNTMVLVLLFSMGIKADRTPVEPELYYRGALIGTFIGFGVGHALQGRYKEIGWVFTVGELTSLAAAFAGVIWANTESAHDYAINKEPHMYIPVGGLALLIASVIVFGSFRIWDIIDLWACAVPAHKQKTAALNLPDSHAMVGGINNSGVTFDLVRINF
jgi:hypothetical protein